ncbi:sigma-70 family RNA polymerase sigma factor [Nitriliruptor alkaliphilus]|uniref:sigma-70 family RNA polymerase sigma factor n=1 Tax=Nitriliruptor alkaliphilus TaxID=427918 RepID=UPI000697DEA4|nr:sigma-70 family RNA polymerase sigma factor [Nitriliruptor alkaliphilus]
MAGKKHEGFEALVGREYERLVRALALYCGDTAVAEELAQDAFARAYQRWSHVGSMDRPDAWVHRVAFNLAGTWFRRRYAERRAYTRHGPPEEREVPVDTAAGLTVRAAVLRLPPGQRAAIVHRYFLGRSVAETADALGTSPGAVKQATFKAMAALREAIGDDIEAHVEVDRA